MTASYLTPEQVEQLLRPINGKRVAILEGLSHLEAYDVRAHLTRIFGFGRWGEQILDKTLLYALDTETKNKKPAVKVAYDVTVRLTVKAPDGTPLAEFDGAAVGESIMPTFKQGDAYDMALKTACSQALKRCAIDLGDQFGLSLYRKGSTDALVGRTLVGAPEQAKKAEAVDAHAPEVVPAEVPANAGEESNGSGPDAPPPSAAERVRANLRPVVGATAPAEPATRPQLTAINAAMGALYGFSDRADKLAYLSGELGRDIGSSAELTKAEASRLIDKLTRAQAEEDAAAEQLAAAQPEPVA